MVSCLGYLGFGASNLDAWRRFATKVLGLMRGESRGDARRFRIDTQAWRISVQPGDDDLAYVGFEVAGPTELAEVRRRLNDGGVTTTEGDADLVRDREVTQLIAC